MALDPNETVIRFSVFMYPQFMRIHHDGCVVQPTVCIRDDATNRWHNVKMSREKSKDYVQGNGAYEGGCEKHHNQQQMCDTYCGPPPNCRVRQCSVSQGVFDGRVEFEIQCIYNPFVCILDEDVDETTVGAICDESTDECVPSCLNSSMICESGSESDCRSCRPPNQNLLVQFNPITSPSGIGNRLYYFDSEGRWKNTLLPYPTNDLVSALRLDFPGAFSILDVSSDTTINLCMKDVVTWRETNSTTEAVRYYLSVGADYDLGDFAGQAVCPGVGYTMNYAMANNGSNAYLDALAGTGGGTDPTLANIEHGVDKTAFRVYTRTSKNTTTGECDEIRFTLGFLGFAYDGYYDSAMVQQVVNSTEVGEGNRVWYPIPSYMGRPRMGCSDAQLDTNKFVDLLNGPDITAASVSLSLGAIMCNHPNISAVLPADALQPCGIIFFSTPSSGLAMHPGKWPCIQVNVRRRVDEDAWLV